MTSNRKFELDFEHEINANWTYNTNDYEDVSYMTEEEGMKEFYLSLPKVTEENPDMNHVRDLRLESALKGLPTQSK